MSYSSASSSTNLYSQSTSHASYSSASSTPTSAFLQGNTSSESISSLCVDLQQNTLNDHAKETHAQQPSMCNQSSHNLHNEFHNGRSHGSGRGKGKGPHNKQSPRDVFVGNLSYFCVDEDLHALFKGYANVETARVAQNDEKTKSLMYGFVTFSTVQEARAMARIFNGQMFQGRALRLASDYMPPPTETKHPEYQVHIAFTSEFTSDMPHVIPNEEFIRKHFIRFGFIIDVKVREYQEINGTKQTGYGFIAFEDHFSAFEAVTTCPQMVVEGITINCTFSHQSQKGVGINYAVLAHQYHRQRFLLSSSSAAADVHYQHVGMQPDPMIYSSMMAARDASYPSPRLDHEELSKGSPRAPTVSYQFHSYSYDNPSSRTQRVHTYSTSSEEIESPQATARHSAPPLTAMSMPPIESQHSTVSPSHIAIPMPPPPPMMAYYSPSSVPYAMNPMQYHQMTSAMMTANQRSQQQQQQHQQQPIAEQHAIPSVPFQPSSPQLHHPHQQQAPSPPHQQQTIPSMMYNTQAFPQTYEDHNNNSNNNNSNIEQPLIPPMNMPPPPPAAATFYARPY